VPHYQYNTNLSRQKRYIRRSKKFIWAIAVIIIIAMLVIGIDAQHQNTKVETSTGKQIVTTIRPSVREFDTPYFSFSAAPAWINLPEQSTPQKFVYQGGSGKVLQQELDVYVNIPPKDMSGTYALPIKIDEGNKIVPTQITDHCNTASTVKKASLPVTVTIMGVTMQCKLDSANYITVVGEKGGDSSIKLKRSDGSIATYYFIYKSSSNPADMQPLINIMSTFMAI
jgi:hypothetical protein